MLPQAMPHAMRRAIDIFLVLTAVLLALSLGYRHIIIDAADPYRCNALQANGRWVGGHGSSNESNKHLYWQPPGCLLHEYNAREIQSCLQCNRLLFVGDSTIRQVYWATVRRLDTQRAAEMSLSAPKHGNLKFGQGCVEVEFWWDPFLNSTMLTKEIKHYRSYMESSNSTGTAAMLVGTGLWHAKTLGPMFLPGFKQSIDSVAASLAHTPTGKNAVALPPSRRDGSAYLVLFAPIPLPIQSRLDPAHAATMTPERIQGMNEYLRSAASKFSIEVLWSYSFMTGQRDSAFETDGYHAVKMIADRQADVFLNMRCNSQPSLEHYPFDKTCCNFQPRVYREQLLLLLAAAITALSALFSTRKPRSDDDSGTNVLRAAGLLAMAGLYCFVADRTPIFDKFRKVPNQQTFLLLTALVMFGGLLSIRTSTKKPANTPGKLTRTAAVHTFLPRDQTDEWKGWMQFLILIYHYTGMSSVLWVYQIARLLVASYLFMTGYGHTAYFLKTNDLSLSRVVSVLVRLNLLSCLLAYLMRTDYNFYYFPTLSSFWFLVVYFTVRIRHEPNVVPRLLTLKIVASAIVVQLLLRTPGLLEFVFKFLLETCNMNVNVDEFRFRLSLDAYVVYFGMFAAVLYLQFTGGLPCSTTCLATQIKRVPDAVHVLAVITSVIVLPGYFIVVQRFPDKYKYNWWHPMISPWPVLAFVLLRNATQGLRDSYSQLFAWIGRFSLETFILQYHIWLAADTQALLSLGLWTRDRVEGTTWLDKLCLCCEFIIVTTLFLYTSLKVSHATTVLTLAIVKGQGSFGVSKVLNSIRWKRAPAHSPVPQLQDGHGGKEGFKSPVSLYPEHTTIDKSSSLKVRMIIMLFVMWIGNWLYS